MSKLKIIIFLIIIIAISVLSYFSIFDTQPNGLNVIDSESEVLHAPTNRSWNQGIIGDQIDLHIDLSDSTYKPEGIEVINESLILADFGDMRIKQFGIDGTYIRSYGEGEGRGPSEFQHMTDYQILQSDTLLVLDSRKRELMGLSLSSGDLLFTKTIESEPLRVAVIDDTIILHTLYSDKLFSKYSSNLEKKSAFGTLIEDQVQNSIALSGNIVSVKDQEHFVFSPSRTSYLSFYDLEGNEVRRIIGPDRIRFHKPETRESGGVRITSPQNSEVMVFDLDVYNQTLFVGALNRSEGESFGYSFLDIYDLNTGEYLESVKLPSLASSIAITKGRIFYTEPFNAMVTAYQFSF